MKVVVGSGKWVPVRMERGQRRNFQFQIHSTSPFERQQMKGKRGTASAPGWLTDSIDAEVWVMNSVVTFRRDNESPNNKRNEKGRKLYLLLGRVKDEDVGWCRGVVDMQDAKDILGLVPHLRRHRQEIKYCVLWVVERCECVLT